jgi:hypothetical protein
MRASGLGADLVLEARGLHLEAGLPTIDVPTSILEAASAFFAAELDGASPRP